MTACEKCWSDAYLRALNTNKTQTDYFHELVKERRASPCTPKEQAGQWWDEELGCDQRNMKARIAELLHLVDLKDSQLAECTRVMREVATELEDEVVPWIREDMGNREGADRLQALANMLSETRAGKATP